MDQEYNIKINSYHIIFIILLLLILLIYKNYENFSEQSLLNINNTFNSQINGIEATNSVYCNNINIKSFKGIIVAWSGTIETIPRGWVLCDGTNSTPDLRSRFIVGASPSSVSTLQNYITPKRVNDISGSETVTLNENDVPSHTHSIDVSKIGCTGNRCLGGKPPPLTDVITTRFGAGDGLYKEDYKDPSRQLINGTTTASYTTQPHNNMPPYYALAFIMKT
jgi:microcystin-dependent protein